MTSAVQNDHSSVTTEPSIYLIILSDGSGTGLWTVSQKSSLKQFSWLIGTESLFQAAAQRVVGQAFEAPIIVMSEAIDALKQLAFWR